MHVYLTCKQAPASSHVQASIKRCYLPAFLLACLPACLPAAPLYADRAAIVNGDKAVPLPEGETAAADEPGEAGASHD
jgi:hypothetical protein